jgi:phage baseplate assembly protein W
MNNPLEPSGKAFLGRGWSAPMALDPRTGLVKSVQYEDDIRQSILIILMTAPGERMMRPDFGCGIHDLVFTSLDSTTIQLIGTSIEDAMRRWEPRIELLNVTVDEAATSEGILLVQLEYQVRRTNQLGNLVFPFYFKEGGQP